jgi:hypothetical protein
MRIIEICLSLMLLAVVTPPPFRGWKGIVPLHSTRADVERELGAPVTSCVETCNYNTPNESVTIVYVTHACESGDNNSWRVPAGTVVTVIVYPSVKPRLKDLKVNSKSFTKTRDPELVGHWTYTSKREGTSYEVSNTGRVQSIEWFPTNKDDYLRCDQ